MDEVLAATGVVVTGVMEDVGNDDEFAICRRSMISSSFSNG